MFPIAKSGSAASMDLPVPIIFKPLNTNKFLSICFPSNYSCFLLATQLIPALILATKCPILLTWLPTNYFLPCYCYQPPKYFLLDSNMLPAMLFVIQIFPAYLLTPCYIPVMLPTTQIFPAYLLTPLLYSCDAACHTNIPAYL